MPVEKKKGERQSPMYTSKILKYSQREREREREIKIDAEDTSGRMQRENAD